MNDDATRPYGPRKAGWHRKGVGLAVHQYHRRCSPPEPDLPYTLRSSSWCMCPSNSGKVCKHFCLLVILVFMMQALKLLLHLQSVMTHSELMSHFGN